LCDDDTSFVATAAQKRRERNTLSERAKLLVAEDGHHNKLHPPFLAAGFAAGCKKGEKSVSEETSSRHAALQLAHAQRAGQKCGQSLTAGFKTARMASSKTVFRLFWLRAEHSTYFSAVPQQNSDNRARTHAHSARAATRGTPLICCAS
jgi:hypothetical protein